LGGSAVKKKDILSSLFWMAVGFGVCYGGYDLELGTLHDPGSGFMFFWVGVIVIGLSLAVLVKAIRMKADQKEIRPLRGEIRWKKIFSVLAALVLYAYVFTYLGFILSTVLLLLFLFKAVEPQKWSWAVLGAVISTLTAYGVFQLWLGSQLPRGFLG
jgi:putative tricarboxylic transport membrane protein